MKSRVRCVCPACRGELADAEAALVCGGCGKRYRSTDGSTVFVEEVADAHKALQREIYEGGRNANIVLPYAEREAYRARLEGLARRVAAGDLPFRTMKDLMNERLFRRVGFEHGMEVLDIGAGSGAILNTLACAYGVRGTGVDISELAARRVLEFNPMQLRIHIADAEHLPFADGSFDRVVSFDVLEHLPNQRAAVAEAVRVLRPGGRLLLYAISSADAWTWHATQRALSGGFCGEDTDAGHVRELFLDPPTLARWLAELGCTAVRVVPFHAFTTLLIDERLQRLSDPLGRRALALRALFALARAADLPWTVRGAGNGCYVYGTRGGR